MRPKLIVINGFAGAGKTTLAKRYIREHPLSFVIEGDKLIVDIGEWVEYESQARQSVKMFTYALVRTQLELRKDVIVPCVITDNRYASELQDIAVASDAQYHEIYLNQSKEQAINRLWQRGTWGEEGLEPLGGHSVTEIERLFNDMIAARSQGSISIEVTIDDIEQTYSRLMEAIQN